MEIKLNTYSDKEHLFNTIHGFVCKDFRVSWSNKYDCAMDIWLKLVDFEGPGRHINITYLRKRVKDRVTNWLDKAYNRREFAYDGSFEVIGGVTSTYNNFLKSFEIQDIVDKLPEGCFETFQALFNNSASEIAEYTGKSARTVRNYRKQFLNEMREVLGDTYETLLKEIKNPDGFKDHQGQQ